MANAKMRPGSEAQALKVQQGNVNVLVIQDVSMVFAASYNMLDFRATCGRAKSHDVSEGNYRKPGVQLW
eukprot:455412-Pyramimonas_sp.AAC.1